MIRMIKSQKVVTNVSIGQNKLFQRFEGSAVWNSGAIALLFYFTNQLEGIAVRSL